MSGIKRECACHPEIKDNLTAGENRITKNAARATAIAQVFNAQLNCARRVGRRFDPRLRRCNRWRRDQSHRSNLRGRIAGHKAHLDALAIRINETLEFARRLTSKANLNPIANNAIASHAILRAHAFTLGLAFGHARTQRKRTAARSNRSVDDHSRQRRARRPHRITPRHQHATRRNRSSVRLNNRKSNR